MTELEKCISVARSAGCLEGQVEKFIIAGYIPYPWQWEFHAIAREADKQGGPVDIGVGGARGPGKSHAVLSQIALDDCQRVENLKCLFLRQTGLAAKESFDDLVTRVISGHAKFERSAFHLSFPNTNSKILLGGFKDERDIDRYIGIEYDIIAVEELNQLPEGRILRLRGSLRTSKLNWRPRMYTSFNPGGKGHSFVKKRYVLPFRENRQTETRFVPSNYKQNPNLNPEYIQYLESLAGNLGKAWREGDFDIFEGQFFNTWRYEKHTTEPFVIPETWPRFGGYDHGRAKPAVFYWFAIDYDGRVYIYRELYVNQDDGSSRWEAEDIAKEVTSITQRAGERLNYVVADSSIFSKTGHAETIAEILMKNGMGGSKEIPLLIPSHKDRIARWTLFNQYLSYDEKNPPKLVVFNTCVDFIRTIPELIHDEIHSEDLDSDGEDHAADAVGYFLQTVRAKSAPLPMTTEQRLEESFNKKIGKVTDDLLGMERFNI